MNCSLRQAAIFILTLALSCALNIEVHAQDDRGQLDLLMKKLDSAASSDPTQVDIYAKKALPLSRKLKDIRAETKIETIRGGAIFLTGDHQNALKIFINAIRKAEKYPRFKELAVLYYNTGNLYSKNNDLVNGELYINKGLQVAEALKDKIDIADGYNRIGVIYEKRNKLDTAFSYYQRSLNNYREAVNPLGMSYSLENMAGIYTMKEQPARAIPYLKESLQLRKRLNNKSALAIIHINLAETYKALNQPDSAIKYAEQTVKLAEEIDFLDLLKHTHNFLSGLYEQKGDLKKALSHYQSSSSLNDSIYNETKSKQIAELSKKYETEKQKQLIRSLNQQSTIQSLQIRQRNIQLVAAGLLAVFIAGILYLAYKRRKLQEEARLQFEINKQREEAALSVLMAEERERQRIAADLHDGVGQLLSTALLSIKSLVKKAGVSDADKLYADRSVALVTESYNEVRNISHQMIPNALLKSGLVSAVRDFLVSLNSEQLAVTFSTSGTEGTMNEQTQTFLYRVLQEAVNNVIKYAQASRLHVQLDQDVETISLSIEDNGIGFDPAKALKSDGIGLRNIRSRVEYLKGTLDIDSKAGKGTLMLIQVPVHA